jgi:putative transposase
VERKSIRLKGYDYTLPGIYFVTIVTLDRYEYFGEINCGEMILSPMGKIVKQEWEWLARRFPNIGLDDYGIMPNHFHGLLRTEKNNGILSVPIRSTEQYQKPVPGSIPTVIRSFKASVTHRIRLFEGEDFIVWQRNYYEHIIHGDVELDRVRKYIKNNPLEWEKDSIYPKPKS